MNAYMYTFTGQKVNPLHVKPSQIRIEDIAHHLSCINRFNGALKKPVSVAQHSVFVSRLCGTDRSLGLQGLLHDASEAYLGDVTKWLKQTEEFASYRVIERTLQRRIYRKFDLSIRQSKKVDWADHLMVRFEGEHGYDSNWTVGNPNYPPTTEEEKALVGPWGPWTAKVSEELFLVTYRSLIGE